MAAHRRAASRTGRRGTGDPDLRRRYDGTAVTRLLVLSYPLRARRAGLAGQPAGGRHRARSIRSPAATSTTPTSAPALLPLRDPRRHAVALQPRRPGGLADCRSRRSFSARRLIRRSRRAAATRSPGARALEPHESAVADADLADDPDRLVAPCGRRIPSAMRSAGPLLDRMPARGCSTTHPRLPRDRDRCDLDRGSPGTRPVAIAVHHALTGRRPDRRPLPADLRGRADSLPRRPRATRSTPGRSSSMGADGSRRRRSLAGAPGARRAQVASPAAAGSAGAGTGGRDPATARTAGALPYRAFTRAMPPMINAGPGEHRSPRSARRGRSPRGRCRQTGSR